ncbi:MAG: hypothetical protein IT532_04900 [Burkholderiales bacterium]|nr:hypothetical protein [Burkholderiales bacterium]
MPESYIVHVYRREDDGSVIGMVERAGEGRRRPFRNRDELWSLLDARPAAAPDPGGGGDDRASIPDTNAPARLE